MNQEIDVEGKSLKVIGARWLVSQGASTVLLTGILAAIGYLGWYAVKTAVPAHLKQIQEGYTDVADRHEKTVKQVIDSQDKERAGWLDLLKHGRKPDLEE